MIFLVNILQFLEAIAGGTVDNEEFFGVRGTGVQASLLSLESFTSC